MKRIGVLTSGGDAPGMNAAIRAVVRTALDLEMSVVGFKRGYNGILMRSPDQRDDFEILTASSVSNRIHRGGTFLMTARCTDFLDVENQKRAIQNMKTIGVYDDSSAEYTDEIKAVCDAYIKDFSELAEIDI